MQEQILIPVEVLEFNKGVYQGNPYSNVLVRYNKKILKFKINSQSQVPLSEEDVDRAVILELEIVGGQNQQATPRVVGVHSKQ